MTREDEILRYWFGEEGNGRLEVWFQGGAAVDAAIREAFGEDVERALKGAYDHWEQTPRGTLALLLLLDQFPRNIYRDTPRAFAGDERALRVAERALALGRDRAVPAMQRAFFYMPLEHAEDLEAQRASVEAFERLVEDAADEGQRKLFRTFLEYAIRHREIVERFGRFPHRNAILGRATTPEEEAFLQLPGSSF